jgi:hypothetical protein
MVVSVGTLDRHFAREGADQRQQRGARQVEVGDQDVDAAS